MVRQYDIFLSHSSEDHDEITRICRYLDNKGFRVWVDDIDMAGGQNIIKRMENGLANSYLCVAILSPAFIRSKWCELEYNTCIQQEISQNRTILIPALVKEVGSMYDKPFLAGKRYINIQTDIGLESIASEISRNLAIPKHCDSLVEEPIVAGTAFNAHYHVEPSDLLSVQLEEVYFRNGKTARIARQKNSNISALNDIKTLLKSYPYNNKLSPLVLLGEAGIGKTTSCKWLCHELSKCWIDEKIVPIYIPLGNYVDGENAEIFFNRWILGGNFKDILKSAEADKRRIVLFLDGLNEKHIESLQPILSEARRFLIRGGILILSSRPIVSVESLLAGDDPRFFEIQRWTEQQMENYFNKLNYGNLLDNLDQNLRSCFRLPLMAFLLLQERLEIDAPTMFQSISDVYEIIVKRFLDTKYENRKTGGLPEISLQTKERYRRYVEHLAYQMTKNQTTQIEARSLEVIIKNVAKKTHEDFPLCLAYLVNSGLLRCSNGTAAIDINSGIDVLRVLRVSFLHQSFQEYLTAQYILKTKRILLPLDVSHDAFWRDIPIHIVHCFADNSKRQINFSLRFLKSNRYGHPDYLTAARVANEIGNELDASHLKRLISGRIIKNIGKHNLYPYSIETFDSLGQEGWEELRNCLRDVYALENVIAKPEAHLLGRSRTEGNEEKWCRLGRSIYILGELTDLWLIDYLNEHIENISSKHLLYHIGEALLTIARITELEEEKKKIILLSVRLAEHKWSDPIVKGYNQIIHNTYNDGFQSSNGLVNELYNFLLNQADPKRKYFRDEFWQRAHGIEVYSELADQSAAAQLLCHLFSIEDKAQFGNQVQKGYRLVQSSCVKAALRVISRSTKFSSNDWYPFLVMVLKSKRANENGWLCRHLEYLLLKWLTNSNDIKWLEETYRTSKIGGKNIKRTISNVLWITK